ncbi:uncharacterized protein DUF2637 [Haloactinopolyspora alba]|uniref:Uncharacterized protein DUF2637 n=1 Tax=Haloactinopolyspora alba TaxID=648780 RepID=A0A2P8E3Q4_9ACTN|nr:DUF2637 domain-containing protein [Haloactinopolyspora alba]PSL04103.1 uncharacterized protein DUF2637 [Haloactinopolyspora alba]
MPSTGRLERNALRLMLVVAIAMSARALYDVGVAAGLGPVLAAGLPVILDGFAILAARVVTRLSGRAATYPWTLLVLLGAVSVWANALHAHPVTVGALTLTTWQAQAVAALPPVVLGFGFHLTQMVSRADAKAQVPEPEPAPDPTPEPGPEPPSRSPYEVAAREAWLHHGPMTGAVLAERIDSSLATGKRLAAKFRTEGADPAPVTTEE